MALRSSVIMAYWILRKKLNIMKTLSFNTFLWSKPCLPSEVIGVKAVLVTCLYVFPNSESSFKNSSETEYFTLNPGQYPKILFPVTLGKHSLNIVKCWVLQNT